MASQVSDREARAERYFEQDLKGQREWYGKRASAYKNYTQILSLVIIAARAATSLLVLCRARKRFAGAEAAQKWPAARTVAFHRLCRRLLWSPRANTRL
jgi:hypothetical protein